MVCVGVPLCICLPVGMEDRRDTFHHLCEGKDHLHHVWQGSSWQHEPSKKPH